MRPWEVAVKGVTKGGMSPMQRRRYHQAMERIRYTAQRGMRANIRREFRAQEEAILALDEPTMDAVRDILIMSLPDWRRIYESTYVSIADKVYPYLDTNANIKARFEAMERKGAAEETEYEAAIREWIRRECGEKIVAINQVTLDKVKRAYESTRNQIEFRTEVSRIFDDEFPGRSNAIARTETACATNRASVETMDALGFEGWKVWMAVGDADTRDTHSRVDGMRVRQDECFEYTGLKGGLVRMECPLDSKYGAPPEEVVNCRCDVGFEF